LAARRLISTVSGAFRTTASECHTFEDRPTSAACRNKKISFFGKTSRNNAARKRSFVLLFPKAKSMQPVTG
jgi:hypothetical protein